MHKYFRNFTLIIFVSLVIAFVAFSSLYRHTINGQITEAAQRENVAFTHVLGIAIKQNTQVLSYLSINPGKQLRRSPEFTVLDNLIRKYVAGFGIVRVNLYTRNAKIIYSTDMSQLGMDATSLPSFSDALNGQQSSHLITVDHFYNLAGIALNGDLVTSLIPVDWSGDGKIDAVVQVYADTKDRAASIEKLYKQDYIYIALILLSLFAILYLFIRTADKKTRLHEMEIARQQNEIEQHVSRDALTGLPNRMLFIDRLEHAMSKVNQYEKLLAVLSLDLNRFKYVNDKFGFTAGDELLVKVAERLRRCVRDYDTVSHLGGGNFAIVFEDISVSDEASEAANQILDFMSEPFEIRGHELFVTFSIGIALYPFDDDQAENLLQKADIALYQAKEAGRNSHRFYNARKRDKAITRFFMESDLRHAIERNEFLIYYQPIVQFSTGQITGVEALLRWRRPSQEIIPPLEFIPVLEDSGQIIQVGQWVLETACRQGKLWQQQGFGDLKININISAKQFKDRNLLQTVDAVLAHSGLPPHLLNLEITESLLIENRERAIQMLDMLNEKGVSMSVDDFGTGYSSMAYLKNMPIETIKIDKTFVNGIPFDMDDVTIIHAIDYLSKNLRLNVIAEGVETQEQLKFLSKLNVFAIQGYLLSKPLPAAELENLFCRHDPAKFKF